MYGYIGNQIQLYFEVQAFYAFLFQTSPLSFTLSSVFVEYKIDSPVSTVRR